VAELAVEDWDRVQAVNLRAPFVLSKAVLPHMPAAGNGTIVSVKGAQTRTWPLSCWFPSDCSSTL
jgi:NAD(P)-dependent dehydrogenase (short-subunit alcohol dehydrogenase family)